MKLTLGSLLDGIGLPKVNGGKIPPVDIISFGSPCQDYAEEIVIPKLSRQIP